MERAVTLSAEGTNYTADLNGDGAADFFKYRTEVQRMEVQPALSPM